MKDLIDVIRDYEVTSKEEYQKNLEEYFGGKESYDDYVEKNTIVINDFKIKMAPPEEKVTPPTKSVTEKEWNKEIREALTITEDEKLIHDLKANKELYDMVKAYLKEQGTHSQQITNYEAEINDLKSQLEGYKKEIDSLIVRVHKLKAKNKDTKVEKPKKQKKILYKPQSEDLFWQVQKAAGWIDCE